MKSGDKKRVKKGTGGAGRELPAAGGEMRAVEGVMNEGKGQERWWRAAGSPGEAIGAA